MKSLKMPFYALLPALILATACTTDNDTPSENTEDEVANKWIYPIMTSRYLWNDEITSSPSYGKDYDDFFESLLSEKDGKHYYNVDGRLSGYYYSYITKYVKNPATTRADEDYYTTTYGFDYILTQSYLYDPVVSGDPDNAYLKLYATVAYVTPGSPADSALLKRGDHIYKISGSELPITGYSSMLSPLTAASTGTSTVTFSICELEEIDRADAEHYYLPVVTRDENTVRNITLTSNIIDQDPVYRNIVIDTLDRKIGYLVYNAFEKGGDGAVYDSRLKTAFQDFNSRGITDLVLDLRYNSGGYVSSCQLLASLIAPASYTGRIFQRAVDNSGSYTDYLYQAEANTVSKNRVYIIATQYSASASEVLLHCMEASGIEVHHIGYTTEGKNVGMTGYNTENLTGEQKTQLLGFDFEAWPVTFYVEDANGGSYSTDGIDPEYWFLEEKEVDFPELGDTSEPMLRAAITHILTGSYPAPQDERPTRAAALNFPVRVAGSPQPLRNPKPSRGYLEDSNMQH